MRATIDRSGCISCGLCAGTCPEVFEMDGDDLATVIVDVITADNEATAKEAAENCPARVIAIE